MLRFFLLTISVLIILPLGAQKKKAGYLIHKVRAGETFRSIAARYNLTGTQLADYNNLEYYSGALAAKTLRVPRKAAPKKEDTDSISVQDSSVAYTPSTDTSAVVASQTYSTSPKPNYSAPVDTSATQKIEADYSKLKKNLPVLLMIGGSLLLLVIAIVYYRYVNRT